jgi:hypothetical protein
MPKTLFTIGARNIMVGARHRDIRRVQRYLRKFGYLTESAAVDDTYDEATKTAIEKFQRRIGLAVSGLLDDPTVEAIEMPRCGVPDEFPRGNYRVLENYALRGCDYQAKLRTLTYAFVNASPDIPGDGEREAVRRAFTTWQQQIPIDFVEVGPQNNPTFPIAWFHGDHGDGAAFDGIGNVLAHAFYPPNCGGPHAGNCHFDESETWALNHGGTNRDLETVALHEIGHLLGLAHSVVPGSVMFPFYSGERRVLTADDIAGIQALYGRPGPALRVTVHLEKLGDTKRRDNEFAGTRGQSRRLEGFQLEVATAIPNLSCRYMAHLEKIGDVNFVHEGQFIGTRGQSRRLEGFAIELTGSAAVNFNVFYMAHLQGIGDTPLSSNGAFCGTRGQSRRVEGMLVRIEPK